MTGAILLRGKTRLMSRWIQRPLVTHKARAKDCVYEVSGFCLSQRTANIGNQFQSGGRLTKANRRKRRRKAMPPYESSEQIEARMTAIVLRTRDWAINAAKIPFPDESITVMAGPLRRRVRSKPATSDESVASTERTRTSSRGSASGCVQRTLLTEERVQSRPVVRGAGATRICSEPVGDCCLV